MDKIDELLEILAANRHSRTLDEISRSIGITYDLCERIVQFLAEYGFVHVNGLEVKIDPKMRNFVIATSSKPPLQLTARITTHA